MTNGKSEKVDYGVPEQYAFHVEDAFRLIKENLLEYWQIYIKYARDNKLDQFVPQKYYTPVLLIGPPGIGKSSLVFEMAKEITIELGLPYYEDEDEFISPINVIDLRLSQILPEDLKGLPKFSKEEDIVKWVLPEFLPRKGMGILFLDELNLAPPAVQKAAYSLILERRLGGTMYEGSKENSKIIFKPKKETGYVLPKGWVVIAAQNPEEQAQVATPLPPPLINRFRILWVITPRLI